MIHYLIYGECGRIQQRGQCHTEEEVPKVPGLRVEVIEEGDEREPCSPRKETYADSRRMDYPSFGNQLDAIWKALESWGALDTCPEAKAVYDRVKSVKAQYPKE